MSTEIEAKSPRTTRWRLVGHQRVLGTAIANVYEHRHDGTRVLSALEHAEAPDGTGEAIPQWHVSISQQGRRPDAGAVDRALRAFDMLGAEEDNHHPGIARHFWLPVDPARRVACECKSTEETHVEPDGYAWTNPKPETGEACRGCEIAPTTGKPCPIHGGPSRPTAARAVLALSASAGLVLGGRR